MSISKELENRQVPICVICNENPAREHYKTCSRECTIIYKKISTKIWIKNNPERAKERRMKYYRADPAKFAARAKRWRMNNPKKYRAYCLKYYAENKDRLNARRKVLRAAKK